PFYRYDGVALQSDGRIIVSSSSTSNDIALARFNTAGSLDASCGNAGVVDTPLLKTSGAYTVSIESDDSIIAAGTDGGCYVVARYLADGTLDTSYGTDGVLIKCIHNSDVISKSAL